MLTLNQIDALSNREPFTNGGSPHHCEEPEIITAIKRAGDRAEAYEIMLTPDLRGNFCDDNHNRTESRDRIKSYCDLIKRGRNGTSRARGSSSAAPVIFLTGSTGARRSSSRTSPSPSWWS